MLTIRSCNDGVPLIIQKFTDGRVRVLRNYSCAIIQEHSWQFRFDRWHYDDDLVREGNNVYPTQFIPSESTYCSGILAIAFLRYRTRSPTDHYRAHKSSSRAGHQYIKVMIQERYVKERIFSIRFKRRIFSSSEI